MGVVLIWRTSEREAGATSGGGCRRGLGPAAWGSATEQNGGGVLLVGGVVPALDSGRDPVGKLQRE
jgi:hypothetical protein